MKRNFNAVVRSAEGTMHVRTLYKHDERGFPIMENLSSGATRQVFDRFEPMTLRQYAIDALGGRALNDQGMPEMLSLEDITKRGDLRKKLLFGVDPEGFVEINGEEAALLKDCMVKQRIDPQVIYEMKAMLDTDPAATTAP